MCSCLAYSSSRPFLVPCSKMLPPFRLFHAQRGHALLPAFNSPALHERQVTPSARQLPGPVTIPWANTTEIWLVRLVVALAAILQTGFGTRSVKLFKFGVAWKLHGKIDRFVGYVLIVLNGVGRY
jgi:hypothetical protein